MAIPRGLGFLCLAFLCLSASAQPAGAGRPVVEAASASVFAEHASGCVLLNVDASRIKRGRELEQVISVSLFRSASVAGCGAGPALELLASGQASQFDLDIEPRLTGARLKATVPLAIEASGGTVPFDLSVAWTGVSGPLYPEGRRSFEPGVAHVHGYSRAATVSATLTDGTTDYVAAAFQSEGVLTVGTIFASGAGPRSSR